MPVTAGTVNRVLRTAELFPCEESKLPGAFIDK